MQTHLVAFEYGTGAVWGFVNASSRSAIESTIPELDVVEEPPAWMTDDDLDALRRHTVDVAENGALDRLLRWH